MYKVTVENINRTNCLDFIENKSFDTKKEANKFKREMMKTHGMINHAGHTVNYNTQTELYTNY